MKKSVYMSVISVIVLCVVCIISGCETVEVGYVHHNIEITNVVWNSQLQVIEITLNKFPATWGEWEMFINNKEISMNGGYWKASVMPNAPLNKPPTGLFVGTLPWLSPLKGVEFPLRGELYFVIPNEGKTNRYYYNVEHL